MRCPKPRAALIRGRRPDDPQEGVSACGVARSGLRPQAFCAARLGGHGVRHRLLQGLAAADVRIVVLQAPAGHGKSTTLLQIKQGCEARGVPTAWLTLDDADNEPRRFFAYFRSLILHLHGGVDADWQPSRVRRHVDWIIEQLAGLERPVALFIDELQTITSAAVLQFFRELMEYLPHNVTDRKSVV